MNSEEERVMRVLESGRRSVEAGSIFTLNNLLAANYRDSSGLDRQMVLGVLKDLFDQTKTRAVIFGPVQIELEDEHATANVQFFFDAQLTDAHSKYQRHLSESRDDMQSIEVLLQKRKRGWEIVETRHQGIHLR
jgi:hypothetical protein